MANQSVYQLITNRIIEDCKRAIETGERLPWQREWSTSGEMAVSHTNGKPYSLLNQWLLCNRSGEWLTFNQIQKEGGRVKKGEKSSMVVFWNEVVENGEDEDGNSVIKNKFWLLKYYNVFHIDQTEGIKAKYPIDQKVVTEGMANENAERIVTDYFGREEGLYLREHESSKAFFDIRRDQVVVPMRSQFVSLESFYSTLFHEMTHSTGTADRCDRKGITEFDFFGSHKYSEEELVAEIGAAYLCSKAGISTEKVFKNSVAYIESWLRVLKSDPKFIVRAATKAEKAVRYILGEGEEEE